MKQGRTGSGVRSWSTDIEPTFPGMAFPYAPLRQPHLIPSVMVNPPRATHPPPQLLPHQGLLRGKGAAYFITVHQVAR